METRNIIAAISLSAAVIILYSLFWAPPPVTKENIAEQNKTEQNSDAPSLDQKENVTEISREDALKESERILFENEFIKGSISLSNGGAIDDFQFKDYNQTLGSEEKIVLLNPSNVKDGYFFNTGWATNSENIDVPNSKTLWEIVGNNKLTPNNPINLRWKNDQGIIFEKKINLDDEYLFLSLIHI